MMRLFLVIGIVCMGEVLAVIAWRRGSELGRIAASGVLGLALIVWIGSAPLPAYLLCAATGLLLGAHSFREVRRRRHMKPPSPLRYFHHTPTIVVGAILGIGIGILFSTGYRLLGLEPRELIRLVGRTACLVSGYYVMSIGGLAGLQILRERRAR